MALTQLEKDCIDDVHTHLMAKVNRRKELSAQEQSDLDDIKHGDDAERQAVVTSWINNFGIAALAEEIASITSAVTKMNARKTTLETKKTDIEAYVA